MFIRNLLTWQGRGTDRQILGLVLLTHPDGDFHLLNEAVYTNTLILFMSQHWGGQILVMVFIRLPPLLVRVSTALT